MKRNKGRRRNKMLSLLLCLSVLLGLMPLSGRVFAAEPCPSHQVHDEACGYVQAAEGPLCKHEQGEHDGNCGYTGGVPETACDLGCTETDAKGNIIHGEGCAYTAAKEETPCKHMNLGEHDEFCGYREAVDGFPCNHTCALCQADESAAFQDTQLPAALSAPIPQNVDISWYDPSAPQSSYRINSADQLAGLAQLVNAGNAFLGTTFTLTADIDLGDREWTPIGKGYMDWDRGEMSLGFAGIFDGGGHTISGLSVTVNSTASNDGSILGGAALFGYVLGGTVKNLTVRGAVNVQDYGTNDYHMGNNAGVVGVCAGGTVENCINYATITGHYSGGGIVGYLNSGTVTKCINYGTISTSSAYAFIGGMVGLSENGKISLCHNAGSITYIIRITGVGTNAGGIVGGGDMALSTVQSCYNSGTVTMDYGYGGCGGIAGFTHYISIIDCYNSGNIINSAKPSFCGGIGGEVTEKSSITNCYYLNTSCSQGYALDSEIAPENAEVIDKTAEEFNDPAILDALNKTNPVWGLAKGINYPVFLFTIPADYSAVEEALDKVPDDLSLYTDATAKTAADAASAVIRGKMADEQTTVNDYAKAIEDAVAALKYKDADYSAVERALAKADALKKGEYKDFLAVEAAVNAVIRGKNISEQSEVDAMAKAIEDAVAALEYKDADYSAVERALAKADALKKGEYKDFSAVEAAVNAVIRGKNISEQSEVDAMAKAIEDAIANLVKKETSAETSPTTEPTAPKTGDTTASWLWLLLLAATFVGCGALLAKRIYSLKSYGK